jgi:hypothetical protein
MVKNALKKTSSVYNWLRFSGIWVGFVFNPFHWRFRYETKGNNDGWADPVFENCLYLGPIWIRVIIDDGRW